MSNNAYNPDKVVVSLFGNKCGGFSGTVEVKAPKLQVSRVWYKITQLNSYPKEHTDYHESNVRVDAITKEEQEISFILANDSPWIQRFASCAPSEISPFSVKC